jgi:hypothetical protein
VRGESEPSLAGSSQRLVGGAHADYTQPSRKKLNMEVGNRMMCVEMSKHYITFDLYSKKKFENVTSGRSCFLVRPTLI